MRLYYHVFRWLGPCFYLMKQLMHILARSENHTQLAKMSFDEIFDLTAGAYLYFYNILVYFFIFNKSIHIFFFSLLPAVSTPCATSPVCFQQGET